MATLTASRFHPALDRALGLAAELGIGSGAADSLDRILHGLTANPAGDASNAGDTGNAGDTAWSGSTLARTGFPVEIAFVAGAATAAGAAGAAGDPSFRYTAEVAGPEVPRRDRLSLAQGLYRQLAPPEARLDPELAGLLRAVQAEGRLKYGAWLAGRHRLAAASYKLYAEVPPADCHLTDAWERRQVGAPPVLPHRTVQLSMVGHQAGRIELYYSSSGLKPGEIATAMSRVGLEARAPEVLALLQEAYGRTLHRDLPCQDFGWSYALKGGGEIEAFTLYTFANSLFGGDGRIRAAILRLAAAHGWELPLYERISRPLAERRGAKTHHGMFGIVAPARGPLALSFGLTPPLPSEPHEGVA
jgi:hypothetical protein